MADRALCSYHPGDAGDAGVGNGGGGDGGGGSEEMSRSPSVTVLACTCSRYLPKQVTTQLCSQLQLLYIGGLHVVQHPISQPHTTATTHHRAAVIVLLPFFFAE